MSKLVNIKDFSEGLELSDPIKNKFGQVLLCAGTIIDEKHIKLLKIWGVETISVKGESEVESEVKYDEISVSKAESALKERLSWTPKNDNEKDLYQTALQNVLEKDFS